MVAAPGDVGNPAAGPFGFVAEMLVEFRHFLDAEQSLADAALVGHDKAGKAVFMKQRQRLRRTGNPGEILDPVGIAMVDIKRAVAVQENRRNFASRCRHELLCPRAKFISDVGRPPGLVHRQSGRNPRPIATARNCRWVIAPHRLMR